jgi:trimeric autotransporter adhesin
MSFTKRFLTTALVSAAFAGFTGSARASVATVSSSKTISKTASSWASKNTKYGSFGAGYEAGYTLYSNDTGSSKYESVYAKVSGALFGKSFDMASVSAKASAGLSTSVTENYTLGVLSRDILNITSVAPSSPHAVTVDIPCYTFAEAEETVVVGVVPLTMSLSAEGCPDLALKTSGAYSSSQSSITLSATPAFSVDLTAGVGVGVSGFSAGAEVSVTLIGVSVPVDNTMTFVPSTKALTYTTTGTLTLESLSGSIALYAKALFIKYTYTLFDWDGIGGSWVVFSDSVPAASGAVATIADSVAEGSYSFTDPANLSDSGSSYAWYRASDSSGTGSAWIGSSQSWSLTTSDSNKYLKFCVTPKNGVNFGTQACSSWAPVGHLLELFQNDSYGGTSVNVAYEQTPSGNCINLTDVSFNDSMSSFQFYAPTSTSATLWLFKDIDCTGGTKSFSASANGSSSSSSIHTTLDDSWNDKVTSVMVVYGETVSAEDLTTTISANKATASYSFVSNSSLDEATPTYSWRRASSSSGGGATTISNSNSSSYTLTTSDNQMYLSFCVTPTNGYTTGSSTCSDWTSVGHLVELFKDGSYGGSSAVFAYEKSASGTCFNLPNYSFNDTMSSFKFYSPTGSTATLWVSYDGSCSGNTATYTAQSNSSYLMSSLNDYWNDDASSFRVTW